MCAIGGIVYRDRTRPVDRAVLAAMGDAMAHRGPDDSGEWSAAGAGLVSRRLSILDPSPAGHMPMESEDGRVVLVFNGEIYNHVELREELKRNGVHFRSSSDTEVLLQMYLRSGVEAVGRWIGMFAFAVWDSRRGALILGRDRLGVKPLLYRVDKEGLRFASEMRGMLAEPGFSPEPDPEAIHHLLALRMVPHPRTAFRDVAQLAPAHLLVFEDGKVTKQRYWSLPGVDHQPEQHRGELTDRYRSLMDEAVKMRLRSDVPVALLLSGGLDSTAVAYHMRRNLTRNFTAFTIGFPESDYDERPQARLVADRFGIDLHEIEVGRGSFDDLPKIVSHMQVPFADPSLLPMWTLAREVSRHVKVALVGDGGDEMFGGYDRYRAHLMADRYGWIPGLISRSPFFALLEAVSTEKSRRNLPGRMRRFLEGWELPARERNALWLANPGARRISRLYSRDFAARVAGIDPTRALGPIENSWRSPTMLASILRSDQERYLPDDLLFKADITSMAFGLELRSPFLDHRIVELAASIPARQKVRGGTGKWFLRRVYEGRIPRPVLRGRKAGFGIPLDHWLRGDLHGVARDLLLGAGAHSRPYLNRDAVAAVLKIHHAGQRNYDEMIWTLLIFETWLRVMRPGAVREAA